MKKTIAVILILLLCFPAFSDIQEIRLQQEQKEIKENRILFWVSVVVAAIGAGLMVGSLPVGIGNPYSSMYEVMLISGGVLAILGGTAAVVLEMETSELDTSRRLEREWDRINDQVSEFQSDIAYRVEHRFNDDIKNPYDTYSVVFYKDPLDSFELIKFVPKNTDPYYMLALRYVGKDWRFMDGDVVIEINSSKILEYQDAEPHRSVLDSSVVLVSEQVMVEVDTLTRRDVDSIESMRIQYHFDPVSITPEGIENIKRFVAEMEGS